MEWHGINLNHQRPKYWLKVSLSSMATIFITFILSIIAALGLWQKGLQQKASNHNLQTELQQTNKELSQINQQIAGLKNQDSRLLQQTLNKTELRHFLQLLASLPIKGGLDYAQITTIEKRQISLAGKLSPNDFSQLEQFLKQHQYAYKVEHLQTNDQHRLEFNLTLSIKE